MDEIETAAYFKTKNFKILYLNNHIDYGNIESPVQTFQKIKEDYKLNIDKKKT